MTKTKYRYEAITKDRLSDGKSITFSIYPDVFFDTAEEAREWGSACRYLLEKSKNGTVKIVVRDKDNKVVARFAKSNLTNYEYEILEGLKNERISFEDLFQDLISQIDEQSQTVCPLTVEESFIGKFNFQEIEE